MTARGRLCQLHAGVGRGRAPRSVMGRSAASFSRSTDDLTSSKKYKPNRPGRCGDRSSLVGCIITTCYAESLGE